MRVSAKNEKKMYYVISRGLRQVAGEASESVAWMIILNLRGAISTE